MNNAVVSLFANLGTNICLCSKQALPGCVINRLIKPAVMSRITANYDKICFGVPSGKKQWSVCIYLGVHYCHHRAPECTEYTAGGAVCIYVKEDEGKGSMKVCERQLRWRCPWL